tara:strand:+ start:6138 stop:7265 length:1128 start_codon:yes stop_codon:yes gene_type:complete
MGLEEDLKAATADLDLEDDEQEIEQESAELEEEESAEEEPISSEEEESEEEPEEGGDQEEDGEEEAEEEEPAAEEKEEQQAIKNAAVQRIKDQYGIDLTDQFADDDSLLQAFVNQRSLIGQRNDDAQFGKNIRENPAGFFQQYAPQMGYSQGQQQGQQQAPGQQQQASGGVPEYNPDWINQVERDDNGTVVASKPGFDPSIPQKLRIAQEYAEKRNRQLIFSPEDAIGPLVEQAARRIFDQSRQEIEQGFQHQLAEQKTNDDGQQWFRDNYSWLADESGNRPSQLGQAFTHHFNEAMQQTGGNQQFAIEHGMSKIQGLGQDREAPTTRKKKKRPPKTAQRSADIRSSRGSSNEAEFEDGESLYQALKRATSDMDM